MQRKTQYRLQCGIFARPAHLAAVCIAGLVVLFLNLPEVGHCAVIMVKEGINLNGWGVTVDSYNSTNGQYGSQQAGDCGDVICVGGLSNSVPVNVNANIYGRVFAGGTNIYLGTNGAVGTHVWQADGNTGFELGYLIQNTNFPFPNITLPDYSGFNGPTIPGGTVITTNSGTGTYQTNSYDNIICGNWYTTNFLSNTIVTCPSTLVLPNGYAIGNLTIVPGASLTVYVGGTHSVSISGNSILNESGLPSDFVIYCTADVTNFSISGNAGIITVLIAPNANVSLNAGGNNNTDFSGALMANSLTLNGHWNFHFDQALLQQGLVPQSPSTAANLTSPAISDAGQFQFNVTGIVGSNSVVETSTDLTAWSSIFTNALPFTFTDTNSRGLIQNFYRVVYTQ